MIFLNPTKQAELAMKAMAKAQSVSVSEIIRRGLILYKAHLDVASTCDTPTDVVFRNEHRTVQLVLPWEQSNV